MATMRIWSGVFLCLWLTGCGGRGIYPVSGKIVYKDNQPAGKELSKYMVILESVEKPMGATAELKEDGTFEVSTEKPGDGAVLGKHKVVVFPPMGKGGDDLRPKSILDPRYEKFETSGLEIVVEPKKNEVLLVVEKLKR